MNFLRLLSPWLLLFCCNVAFSEDPSPQANKVLFLGNSITLHSPAPDIGWTGNWGMAASAEDKDYVHLLLADLDKMWGQRPQSKVRNVADFERGHATFEVASKLGEELSFGADVVIVAIGENVPELGTDAAKDAFSKALAILLKELKSHGNPAIFVRSCFWPNVVKDEILRKACDEIGGSFVDISAMGKDQTLQAKAERKIEHAGVAGHPGDKGMRAIADAIFAAIDMKLKKLR
jgi:hypothetical protein